MIQWVMGLIEIVDKESCNCSIHLKKKSRNLIAYSKMAKIMHLKFTFRLFPLHYQSCKQTKIKTKSLKTTSWWHNNKTK